MWFLYICSIHHQHTTIYILSIDHFQYINVSIFICIRLSNKISIFQLNFFFLICWRICLFFLLNCCGCFFCGGGGGVDNDDDDCGCGVNGLT